MGSTDIQRRTSFDEFNFMLQPPAKLIHTKVMQIQRVRAARAPNLYQDLDRILLVIYWLQTLYTHCTGGIRSYGQRPLKPIR